MPDEQVLKALRTIAAELKRIREVLQAFVPEPEPAAPAELTQATCPHPEEARIDFGMTQGQLDWQCRICGYRTVTEP